MGLVETINCEQGAAAVHNITEPMESTMNTSSTEKSRLEAIRVPATVIAAALWLLAVGTVSSTWGEQSAVGLILFACGCVLTAIGTAGRIWCLSYISGHKGTELITAGPYSMCRNPLYLFSLLATIGVGLGSGTIAIPLIAMVGFGIYYPGVIRSEERRLRDKFGDTYQTYAQAVPSFFPKARPVAEPGRLTEINIQSFASGLGDSIWFFLAFGGVHILAELHNRGVLPALLSLP